MTEQFLSQMAEFGALGLFVIYMAYQNHLQAKRLDTMTKTHERISNGFRKSLDALADNVEEAVRLLRENQAAAQLQLQIKAARSKTTTMPAVTDPGEKK